MVGEAIRCPLRVDDVVKTADQNREAVAHLLRTGMPSPPVESTRLAGWCEGKINIPVIGDEVEYH